MHTSTYVPLPFYKQMFKNDLCDWMIVNVHTFFQIEGVLAAVDATKAKALGDRYGVKGFPTVKYFK